MTLRALVLPLSAVLLAAALILNLGLGARYISPPEIISALIAFDDDRYSHFIIVFQRLPRALIAIFVGALMAVCGALLQGLTRNPLASPSLLGVTSGALMFVVGFGYYLAIPTGWHGVLAFAGGWFGFISCIALARMAGIANDPRNLSLILAGAIISILYGSIANALMLADPNLRFELLSWVSGNINQVYVDRLYTIWPVGPLVFVILMVLARPLTLITLGEEKAASSGVAVKPVTAIAIFAGVGGAAASVSICGPIGFVGLIVPHIVRPFAGAHFGLQLPANAMVGGAVLLLGDVVARVAFTPFVLHTSVMLELIGGLIFIYIVKRHYLSAGVRAAA